MRAALILAGAAVLAVIAVAAVLSLSCLLFFGCNAVSLFLGAFGEVAAHAVHVFNAEACGQDGNLHFVAQLGIGGQSPFDFEIAAKLGHEVVHVVHFLHHQALL